MKYQIKINKAETVEETNDYWQRQDYITLLDKFNYPGAEGNVETLEELLMMAITDYKPEEAAEIVLEYKLGDELSDNQIKQISNDMLIDKISEEYPNISLHATLFHINQLLFKAFRGKFPNTKATLINCTIETLEGNAEYSKENLLKLLASGISDHSLIKRLYGDKLGENTSFPEAESILWQVTSDDQKNFKIFTSNYWLNKDDIISDEFEAVLLETENH